MNLLYNLTRNKLNQDYINKLTQLLYDCKSTKNYSLKRINLDKAVYKFDKNNELYITLPNFNYKNKSITYDNNSNTINNKNCSIQNFTENGSNFLTNDTNYNISYINPNLPKKEDNKKKLTLKDIYGKREKEQLEKTIKTLLLNEDLEMPKRAEKQIFNELNKKYKFEGSQNKKRYISQPRLFSKRYDINTESIKVNKNPKLIFPQINSDNKFIDYLNIIKTKTSELNSIKQKKSKIYLSPLFFLGKNRDNYLNNINYNSYRKFSIDKKNKNFKNISEENHKYLKIMGKDIHNLNIINNENKFIIDSETT